MFYLHIHGSLGKHLLRKTIYKQFSSKPCLTTGGYNKLDLDENLGPQFWKITMGLYCIPVIYPLHPIILPP